MWDASKVMHVGESPGLMAHEESRDVKPRGITALQGNCCRDGIALLDIQNQTRLPGPGYGFFLAVDSSNA